MSAVGDGSKTTGTPPLAKAAGKDAKIVRKYRVAAVKERVEGVKEDQRASLISSYKADYEKNSKKHGPHHEATLDSLELWAFALHEFRDYRGAIDLCGKAIEARKRIERIPYSIEFLQVHQQLAKNYMGQRRQTLATKLFKENYEWCLKNPQLGEDDEQTLRVGFDLAVALHAVKQFSDAEDLNRKILAKRRQIKAPALDIIMSRTQLASNQVELGKFKSAKVLSEINIELLKSKVSHPALLKLCEGYVAKCQTGLLAPKEVGNNKSWKPDTTEALKTNPATNFVKPKRESIVNYDDLLKNRSLPGVKLIESGSNSKPGLATNKVRKDPGASPPKADSPSLGLPSQNQNPKPPVMTSADKFNGIPAKQNNGKAKDQNLQVPVKRNDRRSNNQKPNIVIVEFRPRSLSHNEPGGSGSASPASQSISSQKWGSGNQSRLDISTTGQPAVDPAIDSIRTQSAMGHRDKLNTTTRPRSTSPQPNQSSLQKRFQPPLFDAEEGQSDAASIHSVEGWFYDLQTQTQELLQPLRKDRCKRVKIAILDSGIDLNHPSFLNKQSKKIRRIATVEDFLEPGGTGQDTCGHGTHCLGLLRRIAPEADIYVARIVKDSEGKLDPNVIAKAINRASRGGKDEAGVKNWDVDIITMSCGFYSWVEVVKEAIEEAYRKPTLIFAAASNNGKRKQVAFPAYMPGVICVNSSSANGTPSDFNPKFDASRSLCFLGENVTSTWITSQKHERRMSGTSVATPIAAAIAALLHEFALQTDPADESLDEILKQQLKWLKSYNGIMEMFALMAVPTGEYRTIFPWNVLSVDFDRGGVAHMIKVAMTKKFGKS